VAAVLAQCVRTEHALAPCVVRLPYPPWVSGALGHLLAIITLCIGLGCDGSQSIPPLPSQTVNELLVYPSEVQLAAGSSAQIAVQANDALGEPVGGVKITFATSDGKLLEVSRRGRISARGPTGSGVVVVSSGAISKPIPVVVLPSKPARLQRLEERDATAAEPAIPRGSLALRVMDAFSNPVPGVEIVFRRRARDLPSQVLTSDGEGIVTLANVPRGSAKGLLVDIDVQALNYPRVRTSYRVPLPVAESPLPAAPSGGTIGSQDP